MDRRVDDNNSPSHTRPRGLPQFDTGDSLTTKWLVHIHRIRVGIEAVGDKAFRAKGAIHLLVEISGHNEKAGLGVAASLAIRMNRLSTNKSAELKQNSDKLFQKVSLQLLLSQVLKTDTLCSYPTDP